MPTHPEPLSTRATRHTMPPAMTEDPARESATQRAERRRRALRRFMDARKLKATPWAIRAGVAQNAVTEFLRGDTMALHQDTLEKLAAAEQVSVAVLLGDADEPAQQLKRFRGAEVVEIVGRVEADTFQPLPPVPDETRDATLLPKAVRRALAPDAAPVAYIVADDSCAPRMPEGTIVVCVPPDQLGRPLRQGEIGIVERRSAAHPGQVERRCLMIEQTLLGEVVGYPFGAHRRHARLSLLQAAPAEPPGRLGLGSGPSWRAAGEPVRRETIDYAPPENAEELLTGIVIYMSTVM